jgi:hypothetical protein
VRIFVLGREGERRGEGLYKERRGNADKQKVVLLMCTRTINGCADT